MTHGKNMQPHCSPLDAGHAPVCVYLWEARHFPHSPSRHYYCPNPTTWRWRVITLLVIAQPPHQSGSAQSWGSDANCPGMGLGYAARREHRDTPNPRVPSPWQWAWGHSPPHPSSPTVGAGGPGGHVSALQCSSKEGRTCLTRWHHCSVRMKAGGQHRDGQVAQGPAT